MPYVQQANRDDYKEDIDALCLTLEEKDYPVGDVTYLVYLIIVRWFEHKRRYTTISQIRGMLMGCLSEFDRRHAFDYEDEKIEENGDVDTSLPPLEEIVIVECGMCGEFNCEYHE